MKLKSLAVLILLVLYFTFFSVRVFSSEYKVGDVSGLAYNDVWKQWFDQDFSIWVYIVKGVEMIGVISDTGIGKARVFLNNTDDNLLKLKNAISKSIEWSNIAVENKADVNKELACFGKCSENALGFKKGQVNLTFISANEGLQTSLVLEIIDYDNMFIKTLIYIDLDGMKKLRRLMEKIPSSFVKAREKAEKEKLFK